MSKIRGSGRPPAYRLKDGSRVPGVTTVVNRFKDSQGLIRWAYNCGRDGIDMDKTRDQAADAGHIAHSLIEASIHGVEAHIGTARDFGLTEGEYAAAVDRANAAFGAFANWRESVNLEIVATEVPLISEQHRFGGTLDAVARINGELALLDWKTSARVYPDHLVQISAYRFLWEEHNPEQPIESMHLVRVDKEFAGFAHHSWPMAVLDKGWDAFLLMRGLYDLDALLKRAAA